MLDEVVVMVIRGLMWIEPSSHSNYHTLDGFPDEATPEVNYLWKRLLLIIRDRESQEVKRT